jgi:hypothetical protein
MIIPKLTPAQRALVDEYAQVRDRCLGWKPATNPHMARYFELGQVVLGWFDGQPADEPILATGFSYSIPVSARRRSRSLINLPKLFKKLGMKWVLEHCRLSLTDIERAPLPAEVLATFIVEARDGPRTLGEPVAAVTKDKAA